MELPLPDGQRDVDTDQIIPSDWLKRVERTGFEKGLFSEWRDEPDFVLNREEHAGATILVAGPNFGTGSSREHAVWALHEYGFRAIVAPSFGAIFYNNCVRNGLLPVELPEDVVQAMRTSGWDEEVALTAMEDTLKGVGFASHVGKRARKGHKVEGFVKVLRVQ